MAGIEDILASLPIDQIAAKLGVDPATAQKAVDSALPALLGGMKNNASDPAGAEALAGAVAKKDGSLVDGGVSLDQVDTADGDKILGHIFGGKGNDVAQALGAQTSGIDASMVQKLLPMLAPIVMSFLAKQGGGAKSGAAPSGGGIQDILGSLLGGGAGGSSKGGPDIGSILGSIMKG